MAVEYIHIIDCNAHPFVPKRWKVESHKESGKLEWNPENIMLYLSGEQKVGKWTKGNSLRNYFEDKPVLNANVLDYLLTHPELIPESWKDKVVFFWGTIYRDSASHLCVRSLCWLNGRWGWNRGWISNGFRFDCPAALFTNI